MKVYMCAVCGFIYNEAEGLWADAPETWLCPECSVSKADFIVVDV